MLFVTGMNRTIAYGDVIVKIEQISKWLWSALMLSLVAIALFPLIYTGVAYYILDLGVDSFFLYPPTEFVWI